MQTVEEQTSLFQRNLEGALRAALDCEPDEKIQYLVLASREDLNAPVMTKPVIAQAVFGDVNNLVLQTIERCENRTKMYLLGAFDIARAVTITKQIFKVQEYPEEASEE